jgi:hypothetical protein
MGTRYVSLVAAAAAIALVLVARAAAHSPSDDEHGIKRCHAQLYRTLNLVQLWIRERASHGPPLTWTQYSAAPHLSLFRTVHLTNADFATGTVRITTPGLFVLTEDVVFEPNPGNDHRPDLPAQTQYAGRPFTLGFFAAISVESVNVVLDLGGHSIRQSTIHALQQRFFSVIELASAPFISGQGPADFGPDPDAPQGLVIENGTIGRSSHHGLHGNGGKHVLLRDLVIEEYEVAAVALNGFKSTLLLRVHARGVCTTVPVLGTYSNARFILPTIDDAIASPLVSAPKKAVLGVRKAALLALMAHVVQDVGTLGSIDAQAHPDAHALFDNEAGVCDGNTYGAVIHPYGASVGPFWSRALPAHGSQAASEVIVFEDCVFNSTLAHVIEVVGLQCPGGTLVRGPFGDLLRLIDNADRGQLFDTVTGAYTGNALSDLQIALIDASLDVPAGPARKALFGTTHGTADVVAWAAGSMTLFDLFAGGFRYLRNGDTMFHVNKGVVGVRVDGARGVCFDNTQILRTENRGAAGNTSPLPGETSLAEAAYVGGQDGGHPDQGAQYGYMGADTRGLAISGSADIDIFETRVHGVRSAVGYSRGIDIFNHARSVHIRDSLSSISDVGTLLDDSDAVLGGEYAMGPKVGAAVGLRISGGSQTDLRGTHSLAISEVRAGVFSQAAEIEVTADQDPVTVEQTHPNTYSL